MGKAVGSSTYRQIADAMQHRQPMICIYDGHRREFCPIILGHTQGAEKVLVYQFGGSTSKGPLAKPNWKCFFVADMRDATIRDGRWRSGTRHGKAQSCVEVVDLDANPASPYQPRRRLRAV